MSTTLVVELDLSCVSCEEFLYQAHDLAKRKDDPLLAPHGFFRNLAYGDRKHALEFLKKFGPLTVHPGPNTVRVELNFFWQEQRRFALTSKIYELRDNPDELPPAIERYISHTGAPPNSGAQLAEWARSVAAAGPALQAEFRKHNARNLNELVRAQELEKALHPSPQAQEPDSEQRVHYASAEDVQHRLKQGEDPLSMAFYFIDRELRHHTRTGRAFAWVRDPHEDKFRLRASYDSLLTWIWDAFAEDTTGIPWRVCPNHQKLFYPPRKDRFYCTSREQVAASKLDYEERRNKQRRQGTKRKRRKRQC